MRAGGDLARNGIIRIERERLGTLYRRRHGIGIGEHEAGHAIGQRRLADALRTADQPGMRNAPAAIGIEQCRLGLAVAEQLGRFAGMPDRHFLLGLACAHTVPAGLGTANTRSRSAVQTRAATVSASALASISTQRCGSSAAICR